MSKKSSSDDLVRAILNEQGHEVVSSTPMAPPVGYVKQPSVNDRIRAMVRSELLAAEAASAGAESFEESDDFDVDDEPELKSPYEVSEITGEKELVEPAKPSRTPPAGGAAAKESDPVPTAVPASPEPSKP